MDYKLTNEKGIEYCVGFRTQGQQLIPFYYKGAFWCEGFKFYLGSFTRGKIDRIVEASTGCNAVMIDPGDKVTSGVENFLMQKFKTKFNAGKKSSGFTQMGQFVNRLLGQSNAKFYFQCGKSIDLWQINNLLGNQY